jgi:hypothetical protein
MMLLIGSVEIRKINIYCYHKEPQFTDTAYVVIILESRKATFFLLHLHFSFHASDNKHCTNKQENINKACDLSARYNRKVIFTQLQSLPLNLLVKIMHISL